MTARDALRFVESQGIVLESARGPSPSLVETIAGEPIRGSWWAHPQAHAIFRILGQVRDHPDIAVLRLVDGKISLVHRRLWPALVRLADHLPRSGLAVIREEHTPSGRHETTEIPFPRWVPAEVMKEADRLKHVDALALIPPRIAGKLFREPRGDGNRPRVGSAARSPRLGRGR